MKRARSNGAELEMKIPCRFGELALPVTLRANSLVTLVW
jgi:hypothetical protein